jgi:hypothetical protein
VSPNREFGHVSINADGFFPIGAIERGADAHLAGNRFVLDVPGMHTRRFQHPRITGNGERYPGADFVACVLAQPLYPAHNQSLPLVEKRTLTSTFHTEG